MTAEQIKELIGKMSLREKIGQLNQEYAEGVDVDEFKNKIRNGEIGSIILACSATAGNDGAVLLDIDLIKEFERTAVEESNHKIPIIIGRDVIHGHKTVLPIPLALSATFNKELIKSGYEMVAKEAKNDGIHWSFAPMLDVSRNPRWGRCIESPGEDPFMGEMMAEAVITAFQENGIAACAKHYIGYGAGEGGRDYGNAEVSDYTLRNYYLRAFKKAVDCNVATVMNSFNTLSAQTTSSSKYLLKDILRKELGFDGYVVSDWGAVEQLVNEGLATDKKDAAMTAINAGVDMDMCDACFMDYLEQLVKEGKVSEKTIDDAVYNVLSIKNKYGLFENPYPQMIGVDYSENGEIAEKCSDEALVLLKNKNSILPLSKDCKTVLTGPFSHEKRSHLGNWTLDYDYKRVKSICEVLSEKGAKVCVPMSPYLWDECLPSVKGADAVILCLGESFCVNGEANCLSDVELPREQLEFVKRLYRLGKPIIGVMCFGRPIALGDAEQYFDAILYAWQSGTRTAQSVVKALYGEINPCGKLPMSFPRTTGQTPIYYNDYKTGRRPKYYYEKAADGWDTYRDLESTPLYPFGYGLSYTDFGYSEITCDKNSVKLDDLKAGEKIRVSVDVENIGEFSGKETVQLYINDLCASMSRAWKELKGIRKIHLDKDEQKSVFFEIGFEELGFYNAENVFVVEPGEFEVYIGKDCYTDNKIKISVI